MKKHILILAMLFALPFVMVSCGDDDSDNDALTVDNVRYDFTWAAKADVKDGNSILVYGKNGDIDAADDAIVDIKGADINFIGLNFAFDAAQGNTIPAGDYTVTSATPTAGQVKGVLVEGYNNTVDPATQTVNASITSGTVNVAYDNKDVIIIRFKDNAQSSAGQLRGTLKLTANPVKIYQTPEPLN